MLHGMNGMMVIPVVALLLLVISFFAKIPRGVAWAVGVAALVPCRSPWASSATASRSPA